VSSAGTVPVQVLLVAAVAVLARLPFVATALSSDEGGFLMVAAQWRPGTSLYGDYWVDRPPLIIGLFHLADLAGGGPVALRLLGALGVAAAVAAAAWTGNLVARTVGAADSGRHRASLCAAVTAAVFMVSPLVGAMEVDGELLAVPFVLAGIAAALEGYLHHGRAGLAWWGGAGALAVAAVAVKQDMLEVGVAAVVLLAATVRRDRRRALVAGSTFAASALATVGLLVLWAASRGTEPLALWDAVVTFRSEAAAVIARAAPDTAQTRATGVAAAFVTSGAVGLVALAVIAVVRRRTRVTVMEVLTVAVVAWEAFAVAAGGSYWLHYLVGTVPGLVLAAATAAVGGPARRRLSVVVVAYAAVAAIGAVVVASAARVGSDATDVVVEHYLRAHARPGDTGLVAFGDPALLQGAGLSSPYPELWSLPVRVRDPRLVELTRVLRGPDRPTWVVVDGTGLATWGVDAASAQPVLDREYTLVHVTGHWHVYDLRTEYR